MRQLAVALLHHPVLDREGEIVTTAITNLDIHDIARSAHTYGVHPFFVVHPVAAQRELAQRIVSHWTDGSGARRIPDRQPPMRGVVVSESFDATLAQLPGAEVWVTSAKDDPCSVQHSEARRSLSADGPPVLLCFGTGWGLSSDLMARATLRLAPIASPRADGYNHLSVRAAAAILFDRLRGVPSG